MIAEMLIQLKTSLVELDKAKKIQGQLLNQMINKLPGEKKRAALTLLNKAKKGRVSMDEILDFTGEISDKDKKEMETNLKKANDINK